MPRNVNVVRDMVIDEVSLVDRPANRHARIELAKRATQEDTVPQDNEPDLVFDRMNNPLDRDTLEVGDAVYDAEGNLFLVTEDDAAAVEGELAGAGAVAKAAASPFGQSGTVAKAAGEDSAVAGLREALSKAIGEGSADRELLSKAVDLIEKADKRARNAETIAKAEKDRRETTEMIEKAATYNLPIPATELGPVMKSLWEAEEEGNLPDGSCAVIHKAFSSAGNIFAELGVTGTGDNVDPFTQIEAHIREVAKSGGADGPSQEQALVAYLRENPDLYDSYASGVGQ